MNFVDNPIFTSILLIKNLDKLRGMNNVEGDGELHNKEKEKCLLSRLNNNL